MKDNKKTISFTDDNNEKVEFEVLEQTTITGINYLLVSDGQDEDESEAFILKEIKNNDEDVIYEDVIDDIELQAVAKVFSELLDDGFDIQIS